MKKIINGKKYDTDTANCICRYQFSHEGDFCYVYEKLYIKKTGEFFIFGEGGPMSKYAKSCGNNSTSGDSDVFTPISINEAKIFFEEHGNSNNYEKYFGEVEE
jgi:hypothetical protein